MIHFLDADPTISELEKMMILNEAIELQRIAVYTDFIPKYVSMKAKEKGQ